MSIGNGLYWLGAFIVCAVPLFFADYYTAAAAFALATVTFAVLHWVFERARHF